VNLSPFFHYCDLDLEELLISTMNTPFTFKLGYGLFAGCFLTGAAIGYGRAMDVHVERAAALPKQVAERDALLGKLEDKMRAEGRLKSRVKPPPDKIESSGANKPPS